MVVVTEIFETLLPGVSVLRDTLFEKAELYRDVVKVGRTHLQDATPITLGQEIGGWVEQIDYALAAIQHNLTGLYDLAIGGTAVGTGLNSHPQFGDECARIIAELTGYPFKSCANKFFALSAHDALINTSAAIRTLARDVEIPAGLRELGAKLQDIPLLAANALKDACGLTNPRPADQRQIEEIFRNAF